MPPSSDPLPYLPVPLFLILRMNGHHIPDDLVPRHAREGGHVAVSDVQVGMADSGGQAEGTSECEEAKTERSAPLARDGMGRKGRTRGPTPRPERAA